MEYKDIVLKIIGRTRPVGVSEADAERLENQEELEKLIVGLILEMKGIAAECKDRKEFSISRAGIRADKFITFLKRNYL